MNEFIRIRGARQNNLKGFDLDLPSGRLIVVTGLSGSGKSSLAFDTLYAEGQRRYIETFSPYARQFFDRMDKPRVDAIEGIPPAIALEQRNSVRTTRSTVGTMTEICDHMKVLWPHLARLHCRQCGKTVGKESPRDVWERLPSIAGITPASEILVAFDVPLSAKLRIDEQATMILRQGFRRIWLGGEVLRLEESLPLLGRLRPEKLRVIQDRVRPTPENRHRFVEACEQAYHFGHGKLTLLLPDAVPAGDPTRWNESVPFSRHLHCASCDVEYADPIPAHFSFNHPLGACPECKGFGRVIGIDYRLAIPDPDLTLAEGAVKPWRTETGAESQADLVKSARKARVPLDVPFRDLSPEHQRWVIYGDPEYGNGQDWPNAWYGLKGYFKYLESKAYKMHVRVLLSRYRAYTACPSCAGNRLRPDALLWRAPMPPTADSAHAISADDLSLAEFYGLSITDALRWIEKVASERNAKPNDPFSLALHEVQSRLEFLDSVGVGYLTLDRPTRTLSGGETQRVNLTTCLGTRLVNTLFVLDEPSVGLHPRDTDRLVRVLHRLRDLGNTVVVVEHEAAVMQAADQIIDLGPGHGEQGGQLVAQGTLAELEAHPGSLTGAYLSGRRQIPIPVRRTVTPGSAAPGSPEVAAPPPTPAAAPAATLSDLMVPYRSRHEPVASNLRRNRREPGVLWMRNISRNNLDRLSLAIPLARLVCLTGVSGSGKTTLVSELIRLLEARRIASKQAHGFGTRETERDTTSDAAGADDSDLPEVGPAVQGGWIEGAESVGSVLLVDQAPIGRTPRSNPAVYTGTFRLIREVFASTGAAQRQGLNASSFSFNSKAGQCETCRGAGFEKIEMQFLSDVFVRCPTCEGRRYRPHILEIRIAPIDSNSATPSANEIEVGKAQTRGSTALTSTSGAEALPEGREGTTASRDGLSIADVLELTVDDAISFLRRVQGTVAERAADSLEVLCAVGLGYLRLGQPINTLSGGECQRLKLAGHLVETGGLPRWTENEAAWLRDNGLLTLFVFDEPTTGLHFEDVRILLEVFQRLVDSGYSVLVIEHNMDVVKSADWVIDLGPDGGRDGGQIVAEGTPEEIAKSTRSRTGQFLRRYLDGPARRH